MRYLNLVCWVFFLQACAGGGSYKPDDIGLGMSITPESRPTPQPVYTYEVMSTPISEADPNKPVNVNTNTYDLTRAQPDTNGPGYSNWFAQGDWSPVPHLKFWGKSVTSSSCTSNLLDSCAPAKIAAPVEDVLYAWRRGWTGKGVNVMIEDGIKDDHGVVTALIAYRYAPGANYYGLDVIPTLFTNNVFDQQLGKYPSSYTSTVNVGVVNASYTADLKSMLGDKPWTEASLLDARVKLASSAPVVVNRFKDAPVSGQLAQFKYADAVITKAAGNDSILAEYEPLNWFLAKDSVVNERLLIVGALNKAGSVDAPADKASYSNTAGNDSDVSSRFLLASGTIPFGYRSVAIDSVPTELLHGTSFAAPRVAGYVAILRSKFPNLSGKQSASIMLDTAGYETLSCNTQLGGCDPKIYGKGEANLSRALAPVGKLR